MSLENKIQPARIPSKREMVVDLGYTGYDYRNAPNQTDYLPQWRGQQKFKLINEMLKNEPLIAAMDFAIKRQIKQVEWKIEPVSDSAVDVENAEFVNQCIKDMSHSWDQFLEEVLTFIPYGFSVHEIVYKIRAGMNKRRPSERSAYTDGRIGWRKMPIRGQSTIEEFTYDPKTRECTGVMQRSCDTHQLVFIPIDKLLLFRAGVYRDDPVGESVYRGAYTPYYFKKQLQRHQAVGTERNLVGLPVFTVPSEIMASDASATQRAVLAEAKNIVTNLRRDEQEGVVIPSDVDEETGEALYDLKLLSMQGKPMDVDKPIERYSREILMPMMADFLLLGHESVGSFALSSSKTKMFSVAISNFMEEISSNFNKHAIPKLLMLNRMNTENGFPILTHGDVESENLEELSLLVERFTNAGFDLSGNKENIFRRAGLDPERESEDPVTPRERFEREQQNVSPDPNDNNDDDE